MDCATMRSDVIGDFQEPYGAVLVEGDDMAALPSKNAGIKIHLFHLNFNALERNRDVQLLHYEIDETSQRTYAQA